MSRSVFRVRSIILSATVGVALTFPLAHAARADADGAKKDLAQAKADVEHDELSSASDNLRLAEAELDGVPEAEKAPIAKDIADLRQKITATQGAAAKALDQKQIDGMMAEAKGALDAPQTFTGSDQQIQEFLAKDDVRAALGDEAVQKYLKELSVYRKVAKAKAAEANLAQAKNQLDAAEKDWPDKLKAMDNAAEPGDQQTATEDFGRTLDQIEAIVKDFPDDNPTTKAQKDRFARLSTAYKAETFKSKAAETYTRLKDSWDSYADNYAGWEKETDGPTFDFLLHHQGDAASKLNAPKTVELISRSTNWLSEWVADDAVKSLSEADPKIKGLFDDIRGKRSAAQQKMAKFATAVMDGAEKATLDKDARDRLETLATDDLPTDMEGSSQLKPVQDRAMKLVRAFDMKAGGDAAAKEKLYDDLVAQGAKAWPAMVAKIKTAGDFDANAAIKNVDAFKGKAYRLKGVRNRMGWDYSPGNGFQFALTLDGTPVAAKYDDAVKSAVKDIETRTAKDFSNEEYDVIVEVVDVGPVVRIARSEGEIKTDGGEKIADVTAQRDEVTQGVRMKVVALHVGPVTAAVDQGVVDQNGNVGQPGGQ